MVAHVAPRPGIGRRPTLARILGAALLLAAALVLAGCGGSTIFGPQPTPAPVSTPVPVETPGPSPTPDAVRPDDIVYVRKYVFGLSGDLYLVHADHLAPRQITQFTREQRSAQSDYPVWSPDHTAIAFASEYRDLYNEAVWNLYRADPQGQGAQQITGLPQPNGGYFPALECSVPGVSCEAQWTPIPGVPVRGRVLAGGRPVAGAVVVSWAGRGLAYTGADGTYTLAGVPPQPGWIKATGDAGAGWTAVTPTGAGPNVAPDIVLDLRQQAEEYRFPAWDPRGGLWTQLVQHWFDPATHDAHYETHLIHLDAAGGHATDVYSAVSKTLGRPRANPAHPEQVAVVDGTDLVLLTTDLAPPAGHPLAQRRVLQANVLRNSPVAWSPDGTKLYYCLVGAQDPAYDSLQELVLVTGARREVTLFRPDVQENSGFDVSPDGSAVVYEELGDLFTRLIGAPPTARPTHITFYGQSSQPTWGGH